MSVKLPPLVARLTPKLLFLLTPHQRAATRFAACNLVRSGADSLRQISPASGLLGSA